MANTGICLPSNRGFIDDKTVTTVSNIQVRWIPMTSNKGVWKARILFKPVKSKCLVVRKGTVTDISFKPNKSKTLTNNQNRWLRKWFDSIQPMTASWRWLRRIERMVYSIATSRVVKLGQLISKLLTRWLGLSLKVFPKIVLYIRQTHRCLSVCWLRCIRWQWNASYSHSDTL